MKRLFKEYWDLTKKGFAFIERHPAVYIVVCLASGLICATSCLFPLAEDKIKYKIDKRRQKKLEKKSEEEEA